MLASPSCESFRAVGADAPAIRPSESLVVALTIGVVRVVVVLLKVRFALPARTPPSLNCTCVSDPATDPPLPLATHEVPPEVLLLSPQPVVPGALAGSVIVHEPDVTEGWIWT